MKKKCTESKPKKNLFYTDVLHYVRKTNSWLIVGAKSLHASMAAKKMDTCAVPIDLTSLKGDSPIQPKASPVNKKSVCPGLITNVK